MVETSPEQLAAVMASIFTEEEREFLKEMLEPEMHQGKLTLEYHQGEALESVDDIEAFMNNMSRQQRRMKFIAELYKVLERSDND